MTKNDLDQMGQVYLIFNNVTILMGHQCYHYYEYPGFHSVHAHYGIKGERYKLIYYYEDNVWELFDLKYDPHEIHNIYDEPRNRRLVKKLKTELEQLQHLYEVKNGN